MPTAWMPGYAKKLAVAKAVSDCFLSRRPIDNPFGPKLLPMSPE